jgi:hypothetical protein
MALPDVFTDPVPLAILTVVLFAIVQYQRTLTWTEYRQIHRLKRRFFPLLDRVWPRFVHAKGMRDDAEFLTQRNQSVKAVFKQLVAEGGSPHVLSSLKVRVNDEGRRQYTAAHVVWTHDDNSQTEAYLFGVNGVTDVYAHHEPSVITVKEHLDPANQTDGDVRGVVRDALGME